MDSIQRSYTINCAWCVRAWHSIECSTALWCVLTKSLPVEIHFTKSSFSLETICLGFFIIVSSETNIVYKRFKIVSPDEILTERTYVHWVQQYSLVRSLPIEAELSKSWANWVSEPFESMTQTATEALSRGRRGGGRWRSRASVRSHGSHRRNFAPRRQ